MSDKRQKKRQKVDNELVLWDKNDPPADANADDTTGVEYMHLALPDKKGTLCRHSGCHRVAATGNFSCCPFHRSRFVPKNMPGAVCSKKLGIEFMSYGNGIIPASKHLCACGQVTCKEIGYPNAGTHVLPRSHEQAKEWMTALNIPADKQEDMMYNVKSDPRFAWWHFYPQHRELGLDGKWRLKSLVDKSLDDAVCKKQFSLPPPVYPMELFIENYKTGSAVGSSSGYEQSINVEHQLRAENISLVAKSEALAWALEKKNAQHCQLKKELDEVKAESIAEAKAMAAERVEKQVALDQERKAHSREIERLQAIIHLQEVKLKKQSDHYAKTITARLQIAQNANTTTNNNSNNIDPAKLVETITKLQEELRASQERVGRLEGVKNAAGFSRHAKQHVNPAAASKGQGEPQQDQEKVGPSQAAANANKQANSPAAEAAVVAKVQDELRQSQERVKELEKTHAAALAHMRGYYEHSLQWHGTWSLQQGGRQMHEINALRLHNASLNESLDKANANNKELQQKLDVLSKSIPIVPNANPLPTPLRFKHFIQEGSFLKNHCKAFFPFPNMESINLFLEAINVKKDGVDGGGDEVDDGGVCSRLRRRCNNFLRLQKSGTTTTVNNDLEDEPDTRAITTGGGGRRPVVKGLASGGRPRSLDWKDEFLIYCMYHYGNMSQKQIKALTQASGISEVLHPWANYLDIVYAKTFPGHYGQEETTLRRHSSPEETLIATFLNRQKGGAEKLKLRKNNNSGGGGGGGGANDDEEDDEQPCDDDARTLQYRLFSPQDANLVEEKITPTLFSPLCNHLREMKKAKGRASKDAEE